ncbi:hypothetical protein ACIRL2_46855 [Embleya sp. NPDC127516]|uniref:hypothetical protein n=1 Tax=Embleya sp. NPDC127516 TaxID=3363990 RepID=UPI00380BE851
MRSAIPRVGHHRSRLLRFVVSVGGRTRTVTAGQAVETLRAMYLGVPRHLHAVPAARRPGLAGVLHQLWQQGSERPGPWRIFDPGVRLAPALRPTVPRPPGRDWFESKPRAGTTPAPCSARVPFPIRKR